MFSILRPVATCQRIAAPICLAQRPITTASSPWPSPPKEERETTLRPASIEMRVMNGVPERRLMLPLMFQSLNGVPERSNVR